MFILNLWTFLAQSQALGFLSPASRSFQCLACMTVFWECCLIKDNNLTVF